MGSGGLEVRQASRDNSGSISCTLELKSFLVPDFSAAFAAESGWWQMLGLLEMVYLFCQ
jgi:hypothetical protein